MIEKKISIIVPVYNEEEMMLTFYKELCLAIDPLQFNFEVIFVNDGSRDNSEYIIRELAEQDSRVKGIFLSRNFGHQAALTAGIDYAKGDAVISMDGDLQHPPNLIEKLIEEWLRGYDIVFTIRQELKELGIFKNLTSKLYYRLINSITQTKVNPNAADFRLIDRKVANVLRKDIRERSRFLRGIVVWLGFKSVGVEFKPNQRVAGKSKYNFLKMLNLAKSGIVAFSTAPLTLGIYLGIFLGLASVSYGIYAIIAALFTNKTVPGWTSLLVTITFIGAVQFFLIGLLGAYIAYIFEEVKSRPIYIVKDVTSGIYNCKD